MTKEVRVTKGFVERVEGRKQNCRVKKAAQRRRVVVMLSLILMVLTGTVNAQESIEHGFFITAPADLHPEVPRISAAETKKLFDEGKLLLINAMEAANYAADHIMGSLSLVDIEKHGSPLPDNVIVAIYCN